jgi:hypothetical protein
VEKVTAGKELEDFIVQSWSERYEEITLTGLAKSTNVYI